MNGTKNALFVLSRAPTHHIFTFNDLKHKVCLSKTVWGILQFDSMSFSLKFIFLYNKMHRPFDLKRHNFFEN